MRWARMLAAALMALCLGSALSACGKRGDPEPPPGAKKSDYPRPYPDPKSY
jgi:predicted small lipoprotein YifL